MNSEESRLRTFANWPDNAVVDSKRIARAGFYYMGQGLEVQCFCCGARISDWNYGDKVMAKHKALDPRCPFVQNPSSSGNVPLGFNQRRQLSSSSEIRQLSSNRTAAAPENDEIEMPSFLEEKVRIASFSSWPIPKIVSATRLAKSGFYFTQENTKVRCVFCDGVLEDWRPGDDPDLIHHRQFPRCSFINERVQKGVLVNSGSLTLQSDETDDDGSSFKDLGILSHRIPRSPKYSTFEARIRTFNQWPPSLSQTPSDLADAGFFFTGMGDQVRCFHCDGGLQLWQKNDIPWIEHARWFSTCGFVLLIKGPEFIEEAIKSFPPKLTEAEEALSKMPPPVVNKTHTLTEEQLRELMATTVAIAALQVGIEASRVKSAIKYKIETTGVPFDDADSLIVAALDLQSEENFAMDEEYWSTPPNSPALRRVRAIVPRAEVQRSAQSDDDSDEDEEDDDDEEQFTASENGKEKPKSVESSPQPIPEQVQPKQIKNNISLEEENRRLKEARLCKICMDVEVGVVFLPCGHLVTCANCVHSLKDCPLCRQQIKATVRTFLS